MSDIEKVKKLREATGAGFKDCNLAVKESGDAHTGITIHYVNEHYDEGGVIFQTQVEVEPADTPHAIAQKVHQLEHKHFPRIIEQLLTQ